ncbi:MAG: site-specific integrase [Candidatus Thermoplasmatota archaeon]|nr:site-specific integrase [Candidatus Thermoplasmatota archaeon]
MEGLSNKWIGRIEAFLTEYLDYIDWKIDKSKTLKYFECIKDKYSIASYRKCVYQIRKFLEYLGIAWSNKLNPPPEPECIPKHMTQDSIKDALSYYEKHEYSKQVKAIILLGCTSGMRAEELYQLTLDDIDIRNRIVRINHNPNNGQSTKTKRSRVSFFSVETQEALSEYLDYYNNQDTLKVLFCQSHLSRIFRDSIVKIKDFRKYFSQEWDRRGGPTSIKKILMGHSLKGDVDLMHYNAQSPEDLKLIYDKVMGQSKVV